MKRYINHVALLLGIMGYEVNILAQSSQVFLEPTLSHQQLTQMDKNIYPKAGAILKQILIQYKTAIATVDKSTSNFFSTLPFVRMGNNKIVVEISTEGHSNDILDSLISTVGLEHGTAYGKQISGIIALDKVEELLAHNGVRFVQASMSMLNTGSVTTQGDMAMGTDMARLFFAVSGQGIKVGTMSDSYNEVFLPKSFADDVASGDLPADVIGISASAPPPMGFVPTDEGRAMMQIVYDIAPMAKLYFRTGVYGEADFAQGIIELLNQGVHIINDDITNFMEPWFQDGIVAQAATFAVNAGRHFFSAAGNLDGLSYQSSFRDSALPAPTPMVGPPPAGTAHDFDPGPGVDIAQNFSLAAGEILVLPFQWSQPFSTACSEPCAGPTTDLDLALFDSTAGVYVAIAATDNVASGQALEILAYQNPGPGTQNVDLIITNANGGESPQIIKYLVARGSAPTEFFTKSSTLVAHANGDKINAVAAAAYFNTPAFSVSPPVVNVTSALAGTPILFDTNNNPLATPLIRQKPMFTGPDGGNNTFFGTDTDMPPDGFPNFFGTSAATPHVAGLAALILHSAAAPVSPELMTQVLQATAIDILEDSAGNPVGAGFDPVSGAGLVVAPGANGAVCGDIDHDNNCLNTDLCPTDADKTKPGSCGCGSLQDSCGGGDDDDGFFLAPLVGSTFMTPLSASSAPLAIPILVDAQMDREVHLEQPPLKTLTSKPKTSSGCQSVAVDNQALWLIFMVLYFLVRTIKSSAI